VIDVIPEATPFPLKDVGEAKTPRLEQM